MTKVEQLDILFSSRLQRCNEHQWVLKKFGERRAGLIKTRLADLRALECLEHVRYLPAHRCHELTGDLKGSLAVDLDHPYRLIFEAANDPIPKKADGGLDWEHVTVIKVTGVRDYHG